MVGALGLGLVVTPIVGLDLGSPAGAADAAAAAPVPAVEPEAAVPAESAVPTVLADFRVVLPPVAPPADGLIAAVSVPQAAPLPAEQLLALRADAELASRTVDRATLDGCTGVPPATQPANGLIAAEELCRLWNGEDLLRADAAVALAGLNAVYFLRFGADMCLTDSYRSYDEQVAVRRMKPGLAARPGTSQHGWGLAVDVCDMQSAGGEGYGWLRENAPAFGWDNPDWARSGGSGPTEPWHWEYVAGQPVEAAAGR